MSTNPQLGAGGPPTQEVVRNDVLYLQGTDAIAFTGNQSPSTLWRWMTSHSKSSFPVYRELLLKDSAASSAFELRALLLLARGHNVVAADENNQRAKMYADATKAFLSSIPDFDEAVRELLSSRPFGYKVSEIYWTVGPEGVGVEKIVGRPQELFAFGKFTEPQTGPLLYTPFNALDGVAVPEARFLVMTYRAENGDRRGRPLLREVFWPSWLKRHGLKADLAFLEKPTGTVVVVYPSGASDAEKAKALEAATAIQAETAVAVPDTFKLNPDALLEARSRAGQDYEKYINYLDGEITRLVLYQTLTTRGAEQGAGSRALGSVHLDVLQDTIDADAKGLNRIVNDQLLKWWGLWTFGPEFLDRSFRPRWSVNPRPKDRNAIADLVQKALNAGARTIPARVVHDEDGFALPRAEEGEPVLPAAASVFSLAGMSPSTPPGEPCSAQGESADADSEDEE